MHEAVIVLLCCIQVSLSKLPYVCGLFLAKRLIKRTYIIKQLLVFDLAALVQPHLKLFVCLFVYRA